MFTQVIWGGFIIIIKHSERKTAPSRASRFLTKIKKNIIQVERRKRQ